MKPYWNNIFGDDMIFKSSALIALEKEAVRKALEAAEREKAGLDLMEALAQMEQDDDDDDKTTDKGKKSKPKDSDDSDSD